MMALQPVLSEAAALVTATATTVTAGLLVGGYRKLSNVERAVTGDETTDWEGLVKRNREHREALEEEGLL